MARYDGVRKMERNRLLREFKEEHPWASFGEIGKIFGISRQRVQQLTSGYYKLKSNGEFAHWFSVLRQEVMERDKFICVSCGASAGLIIHHWDGDDTNNEMGNLATVCRSCHQHLHIYGKHKKVRNKSEEQQKAYGTLGRNWLICKYYKEGKRQKELVRMFALSKQRVGQVIKREEERND